MTRYRLAEQARQDFDEVWLYSAEDNTHRSSRMALS
jgi:plasmid stabilization system protein ParE